MKGITHLTNKGQLRHKIIQFEESGANIYKIKIFNDTLLNDFIKNSVYWAKSSGVGRHYGKLQ